jgi:methylated-DNA-[protein]-cysteine S-methyltransferase
MNFQDKVLNLCKKIPKGRVTTYKQIGRKLGGKGQIYRAVGKALHDNKCGAWGRAGGDSCRRQQTTIPCHRVVSSDGSIGGYSKGVKKKIALLKKEGVEVKKGKIVDFKKKLF